MAVVVVGVWGAPWVAGESAQISRTDQPRVDKYETHERGGVQLLSVNRAREVGHLRSMGQPSTCGRRGFCLCGSMRFKGHAGMMDPGGSYPWLSKRQGACELRQLGMSNCKNYHKLETTSSHHNNPEWNSARHIRAAPPVPAR